MQLRQELRLWFFSSSKKSQILWSKRYVNKHAIDYTVSKTITNKKHPNHIDNEYQNFYAHIFLYNCNINNVHNIIPSQSIFTPMNKSHCILFLYNCNTNKSYNMIPSQSIFTPTNHSILFLYNCNTNKIKFLNQYLNKNG